MAWNHGSVSCPRCRTLHCPCECPRDRFRGDIPVRRMPELEYWDGDEFAWLPVAGSKYDLT